MLGGSGHVILVKGYDTNTRSVIVNDPWGVANAQGGYSGRKYEGGNAQTAQRSSS